MTSLLKYRTTEDLKRPQVVAFSPAAGRAQVALQAAVTKLACAGENAGGWPDEMDHSQALAALPPWLYAPGGHAILGLCVWERMKWGVRTHDETARGEVRSVYLIRMTPHASVSGRIASYRLVPPRIALAPPGNTP